VNNAITVLLIDDQAIIGEAIRRMLAMEKDIEFHYCNDPTLALKTAIQVQPTVILQDLVMPQLDGLLLVRFFRADNSPARNIPLIVLSSKEEPTTKAKAFELGANDYLVKLPDQIELIARIRYHSQAYLNLVELEKAQQRLENENLRLSAELDVTRKLQQMILPKPEELKVIPQLDISGFMEAANEVGGDYYDILSSHGQVKIGIGDVTGHGLESGVIMLMVQTAVRTLLESNQTNTTEFLDILNRTIYGNVQRMKTDKNLTLSLLDYQDNTLRLSGQHEEIIVVRAGGKVELIDTMDLGFPIGLDEDIADFLSSTEIHLNPGDGVVLYTDGITEAENNHKEFYGLERLCTMVSDNWHLSAQEIQEIVIGDVKKHIGDYTVFDDITLVVIKQK
jgi:sigma-B regulation protein RsbU (phosphoserine phosphatase)